ncbi:MAG: hypothetical protein HQL68_02270 [Magnetococcales bacterium]|nr:hypothetical protein [Magnetococcales bacterium]
MDRTPEPKLLHSLLGISLLILCATALYLLPDTIRMVSKVVRVALGFA